MPFASRLLKSATSGNSKMKRGDWSGVYMVIVVIIAAVLVVTLIKPLFQGAAATSSQNMGYANGLVQYLLLG